MAISFKSNTIIYRYKGGMGVKDKKQKTGTGLMEHIKKIISFIFKEWVMILAIVIAIFVFKCIIIDKSYENIVTMAPIFIIIMGTLYIGTKINSANQEYNDEEYVLEDETPVYKVGDTFYTQNINMKIVAADLNYKLKNFEKETLSIESGYKAIKVNFKATNMTVFRSFVGAFSCYVDDVKNTNTCLISENYDDDILPKRSSEIYIIYIVPKKAKSIELEYDPLYIESERIIVKIK